MRLSELLQPDDVLVDLHPDDKWNCIDRMVTHLVEHGRLPASESAALREAVLTRERSMSTGMERGIAIPHAAVDQLAAPVAALAVLPEGLSFDSIDATPARYVVLLLIPRSQKLLHIRTLAEIARVLGDEGVRQALLGSHDPREAWESLATAEGPRTHEEGPSPARPRRTS